MKTKQDFQTAIADSISAYPVAAQFYKVGDQRLLAQLDAIAAQFALLSGEIDIAAMEPFIKARESTVLADAAIKGVLPFGRAAKAILNAKNSSTGPVVIATGRRVLDGQGRIYTILAGVTIPSGATVQIHATQFSTGSFTHTVTASASFYQIEVPAPDSGKSITAVRVVDSASVEYVYKADFLNTEPGLKMFQLETDEKRRLFITFGATDIAGYQPPAGEVFTVFVSSCDGDITLKAGDNFALEYSYSPEESQVDLTFSALESPGASPLDVSVLRRIVNYPSLYDSSAVYLGNFDYLVRRNLSPFKFLSVWNEQIEETARGPSVDNINAIFVAAEKVGGAGVIGSSDAGLQADISRVILDADNSYRIRYVDVVHQTIPVNIVARVSNVHDFTAVEQQIRAAVLAEYGDSSIFSQRGRGRIQYKRLYDLLTGSIVALQDAVSDLTVSVTDPVEDIMPENFRYVSSGSLTVTVEQIDW